MVNSGLNQDNSRIHNRNLILKLIKQHAGITRADLALKANLSKPAITKIVNDFIENRVLKEDKKSPSRNKGLFLSEGNFYIVTLYLGRLAITGAVFDIDGSIVIKEKLPTGIAFYGNDNIALDSRELVESLILKSSVEKNKILAICIAAPGAVSSQSGTVFNRSVATFDTKYELPFNWGKVHLAEFLEECFQIPVFLENNTNLSTLAESWFGKGLEVRNFVLYSIGFGIGAGAIINGELFSGYDGVSTEVGHTTVDINGEICFCGNRGCLETVAGFNRLIESYENYSSKMSNEELIERLSQIFIKAEQGEQKARNVIQLHAEKVAIGAVSLINMFSPEKLIISTNDLNGISIKSMLKHMELYIRKHAYPVISEKVKIEMSELGDDIHLKGAYALILENLYNLITEKLSNGSD